MFCIHVVIHVKINRQALEYVAQCDLILCGLRARQRKISKRSYGGIFSPCRFFSSFYACARIRRVTRILHTYCIVTGPAVQPGNRSHDGIHD